ncbi:uncharacterized protein UV8b_08262 [Ustilaginoidea virens]|uniref:Uncharacterized protein n=1 Tax=Ustilaginoidea virens TaxID=1159556 RepID=A0A063CA16_USTVR|nr:uncharacterized protein UV8b_08262 [Ustilaginoidea virens]QUC24021.1 hypothetical protein UV8b_08262 [Ustilaginoidea virens]GAO16229.1 hypothetical protein UVI_02000120 [Ustilaginoidea virens]
MASDQTHSRLRTTGNAASLPIRSGQQPTALVQPKSPHTSDEFLHDFLNPSFDAAAFLNAALPPLATKQATTTPSDGAVPLTELCDQTQTLLSQLNAHTTRLCDTLTQLTDDILRSGSRLAYQVDLLRGETLSLSETLTETLRQDIETFIPGGLPPGGNVGGEPSQTDAAGAADDGLGAADDPHVRPQAAGSDAPSAEPECIKQLRTLTLVRSRLDAVIKTFGDAMEFTFPPSEVSVSSGFLSVSAPEPGSAEQSSEEKGQQVLQGLRQDVSDMLHQADDPVQGIERAAARIEELKELATVWKGTAEEKGRSKFIESLARMVEDRHRDLMREMDQAARKEGWAANPSGATRQDGAEEAKGLGGFGLISQLQKLRNGL